VLFSDRVASHAAPSGKIVAEAVHACAGNGDCGVPNRVAVGRSVLDNRNIEGLRIRPSSWGRSRVRVRIQSTGKPDRIALNVSPGRRVVVTEVVVNRSARRVVPDDDFASALFESAAAEPVTTCAFLVGDPDASFSLAPDRGKPAQESNAQPGRYKGIRRSLTV
jgi:hypothetical protein